jgi:hypothetical protein
MQQNRKAQIREIYDRLQQIKNTAPLQQQYAIEQNLAFLQAARSFPRYFIWLLAKANKIDGNRLLELTDFSVPEWENELQVRLVFMEKKSFPGMITPLRDAIVKFVIAKQPSVLMDFGCGGMELERQVITELKKNNYSKKLTFLGVDQSRTVHEVAKDNLKELNEVCQIKEIETLSPALLAETQNTSNFQYLAILCRNDIFKLTEQFPAQSVDLIYYSKFRHHLSEEQKTQLDRISTALAKTVMEYDDYRSWGLLIPQSIVTWPFPILLNGAVFSRFRDYTKMQLLDTLAEKWKIKFYPVGSYIKTYTN